MTMSVIQNKFRLKISSQRFLIILTGVLFLCVFGITFSGCAAMSGAAKGMATGSPAMAVVGAAGGVPDDLSQINQAIIGPVTAPQKNPDAESGADATRQGATRIALTNGHGEVESNVDKRRFDTTDWYTFSINTAGRITIILNVLKGDADIELYRGEERLYSSARGGMGPVDFIQEELPAGDYHIRIYAPRREADYKLIVDLDPLADY